ncbi:hypothetical protein FXO38_34355, partial [Capsicum annuum]
METINRLASLRYNCYNDNFYNQSLQSPVVSCLDDLVVSCRCVTYLRLDGSVEPEKRFDIVKAFNSDPTIDVLLLTTRVGGLGLNLTSADTLVFMEHDWNPMRDHQ